jgi:transglutaminase-like putative cysteine protease
VRKYLEPTDVIDADHDAIRKASQEVTAGKKSVRQKSVELFYFVRDQIAYNPYLPRFLPEQFQASATLARGEGFCITKAVLLAALSRAARIPARLGFAVLRNHLIPPKLASMLKTNMIPDHGYAELYLEGGWVKATPAFDLTTCLEHCIRPVEFDGVKDAVFHRLNQDGDLHIEYVRERGKYSDLPLPEITAWVAEALRPEAQKMLLGREF